MIDHDKCIGEMLDFLDTLGIADDTYVQYSTDNGPHMNPWPDAATPRSGMRRTQAGKALTASH